MTSDKCARWDRPHRVRLPGGQWLEPSPDENTAGGSLALHDVQLSQLSQLGREYFSPVSDPVQVFTFDLACRDGPIPVNDQSVVTLTANSSGGKIINGGNGIKATA